MQPGRHLDVVPADLEPGVGTGNQGIVVPDDGIRGNRLEGVHDLGKPVA